MDAPSIMSMLEQLEDSIEDVDEKLSPLLTDSLSATARKLPLLERAKLQVTMVYAIESLIFSYLKLNGIEAKEHPVFQEIARIKQYFSKIKEAEQETPKRRDNMTLDKQAAARMIQHSLAGNEKFDLERREREAREKFLAARKLKALEASMKEKATAGEEISPVVDTTAETINSDLNSTNTDDTPAKPTESSKKRKKSNQKRASDAAGGQSNQPSKLSPQAKVEKKARKKAKKKTKIFTTGPITD